MNKSRSQFLLVDAIEHHARFSPNETAAVCGDDRISWGAFEYKTRKLASALLALGLGKGEPVSIYMVNSLATFIAMWGVIRAGGIAAALNVQLRGSALAMTINDTGPSFLLADRELEGFLAEISDQIEIAANRRYFTGEGDQTIGTLIASGSDAPLAIDIDEEDSMTLVYSSGSTGKPKGSEHSHGARRSFGLSLGGTLGIVDRYATSIISTPLCTNGSWITMAPTVFRGGKIVLMSKFDVEDFFRLVAAEQCTHAFMVPTQYVRIAAAAEIGSYDLTSLKTLLSAGQPLYSATYEELQKKLPGVRIFEAYGMSEGFGTIATPEDFARGKRGSVGKPWFLDDIAILGDANEILPANAIGEIAGWSAAMMKGYYRNPEQTQAAIWEDGAGRKLLRSGDLGYIDDDGFLYISGRVKDMIKSGGLNVFAADIEAAFIEHPEVREVVAFSIPDPRWGETPLLLAILEEGATVTEDELKAWGNSKLVNYQRVSRVEFREEFERALYGKANKSAIKAPYWRDLQI